LASLLLPISALILRVARFLYVITNPEFDEWVWKVVHSIFNHFLVSCHVINQDGWRILNSKIINQLVINQLVINKLINQLVISNKIN
jgi:hypothetical protein